MCTFYYCTSKFQISWSVPALLSVIARLAYSFLSYFLFSLLPRDLFFKLLFELYDAKAKPRCMCVVWTAYIASAYAFDPPALHVMTSVKSREHASILIFVTVLHLWYVETLKSPYSLLRSLQSILESFQLRRCWGWKQHEMRNFQRKQSPL